jgi:hypothetical protein
MDSRLQAWAEGLTQNKADTAVKQTMTSNRIVLQNNILGIASIISLSSKSDAK